MRSITLVALWGLFAASSLRPAFAEPPSAPWVAAAEGGLSAREYEPTRQGATWQAPNREQGFRVTFDGKGIALAPRNGEVAWTIAARLVGIGRGTELTPPDAATVRVDGARVIYDRGRITEWYVNQERGLEQGFTLAAPPAGERGEVALALALTGTLVPNLARDRRSIELRGVDGKVVLVDTDLSVRDARGGDLPSRMRLVAGREDLVFDDTGATYPVTVDPTLKLPIATLQSGQNASWFGYSVSTAGDVNGDGYSDVIVGAPLYDNGQDAEGRAFVYLGGPNGLSTTPAWFAESDQAQANFGWWVSTAGDVNGDGYDDVIVCAAGWSTVSGTVGKVYVYLGSATGLAGTPAWTKVGTQVFGNFGSVASTAGDVNGDGYADIIVGASSETNGQSNEGRAYVFLGSASGPAVNASWSAEINQAGADFGVAVATAGDVNGDGYDDVIIGADQFDDPEFNEGAAFVYLGGPTGLAATPVWTAEGNQAGAGFGSSVGTAGDINGDGYAEVVVGAPGYDDPENAEGRAYAYLGGAAGPSATAFWTFEPNIAGAHFGNAVATAGDINGDGFADIVVGAWQVTTVDGVLGRFYVFLGSQSGLTASPSEVQEGGPNYYLGTSVGTAGDVDGDGLSDVVVGGYAPASDGRAYVYRYNADVPTTTPAWTVEGNQANAGCGVSVASAGDVNGDGYSDVLVGTYLWDNGQTDEGKVDLYLGSAAGLSPTPAWTVESNVVNGRLGTDVNTAGDVNGDGYADVIVGAPGDDAAGARVYYGGPNGLPPAPSWTARGPHGAAGSFGVSVASAGDVNGDGYADVVVGAEYESQTGGEQSGAAFLYLGSASGLSTTPAWSFYGQDDPQFGQALFGHSVASAGDINGDGYSDVLVGAPYESSGQTQEGRAYLFLGSVNGLSRTPAWTYDGRAAHAYFGSTVASAGDINGDGYADVAIGATAVYPAVDELFLGGPDGLTLDPFQSGLISYFAAAGDIDNDGFGDLLAGPNFTLLRGSASGQMSSTVWSVSPGPLATFIGRPIASAGDVNGDGFPDIVVGANMYTHGETNEGGAFLYLGGGVSNTAYSRQRGPRQVRSNGTTPIGLYGHSDVQTGFRIVANGGTGAGRSRVRLVWDAKPLGTPFTGAGLGQSAVTDTGTPDPLVGSVAHFSPTLSGLAPGTAYHWRVRTESANPFFPQTPWLTGVGNVSTETKLRTAGCHDLDGDGRGSPADPACGFVVGDCDDSNPAIWARPGETRNLRFTSKTTLAWDAPSDPGSIAPNYDTLRATSPNGFGGATCVESDDGSDLVAVDSGAPPAGQVYYYLTRAEDACPNGTGSLGTDSGNLERTGRNCP